MKSQLKYQANLFTQLTLTLVTLNTIAPAQAIQFNFTYAANTPQEIIDGFDQAGNIWASKLKDKYFDINCLCNRDNTVNIYINFQELSNNQALAGTIPTMLKVDYDNYLTSSFQNITSNDDLLAMKNMQINNIDKSIFANKTLTELQSINRKSINFLGSEFSMIMDKFGAVNVPNSQPITPAGNRILDNNDNYNNKTIWLSTANAKALNLIAGNESGVDAQIYLGKSMLNSNGELINYSQWLAQQSGVANFVQDSIWDFSRVYSPEATVASNKFDFLSIAQHEIGHVLGVVSGVDVLESLVDTVTPDNSLSLQDNDLTFVSPIDLFRYSNISKNQGIFDWSYGNGKYFSLDGGKTRIANFDGGDYQTSHWSASEGEILGIMHPVLKTGEKLEISNLDLQLLDVIGWDINSQSLDTIAVDVNTNPAKKLLSNTSISSLLENYIFRGGRNSTASGMTYLEAFAMNYLSLDEYDANQKQDIIIDDMIQNANLNLNSISNKPDVVSVPEPKTNSGLGILGLMGLGWLFKSCRRLNSLND
ncbi:hypothetical protein H6G33_13760 [Calothrix sp. FACHB-1219]|uniref:NF038122 family metalloprotease n=1 Tax=unclassified Calothrix TaxID=2619626 RepID=UPI0016836D25|nr:MULTISPECIES: NF038122 family metalloprotease [unclassified Calothrix]MBD2204750.1 hypothetical protein [Calothrix sp. FACHB-168]MBD2218102.1 hypothetical protein [Calothrix sp. FACHB-1219]